MGGVSETVLHVRPRKMDEVTSQAARESSRFLRRELGALPWVQFTDINSLLRAGFCGGDR